MARSIFRGRYEDLAQNVAEISKYPSATGPYNVLLRQLYSKIELLLLDIEENRLSDRSNDGTDDFLGSIESESDFLKRKLDLIPIDRKAPWWKWIDIIFRTIGVTTGFITVGVLGSLPIIALRSVDYCLGSDPFSMLSEKLKRSIAWLMLELSGISVEVINGPDKSQKQKKNFSESCSLLTFSHSSNLDGFLVSATCPIRHFALAKKELFMVPFFSWISLAFGGVPVDRGNRDRAVNALQRASSAAKNNQICIVIAPEGMRSTSGQLQPFKKGAFYVWEQLRVPVVPLIFYGAYELYPVSSWVNNTGKVYVRYLDPLGCHEAADRDGMLRLLRRRMLEAFIETPGDIGIELMWHERIRMTLVTLAVVLFDLGLYYYFHDLLLRRYRFSVLTILIGIFSLIICITAVLYIYNVYIVNIGGSKGNGEKKT